MAGPTLLAHWALQKEEKMRAKKYEKVGVQKLRVFPEKGEKVQSESGLRRGYLRGVLRFRAWIQHALHPFGGRRI